MDYFTKVNKEYETIKKNVLSKTHIEQQTSDELKRRHEELLKTQREEHYRMHKDNELRIKQEQALKLQRDQELKKYHQEQLDISDEIFKQLKLQESNKSSMTTTTTITNNNNNKSELIKEQLADFLNQIDKKTVEKCENLTFIPNLDATASPIHSSRSKSSKPQHAVNIFISQDKSNTDTQFSTTTTTTSSIFQETNFGNFSSSEKSLNALVILSDDEMTIEETVDFNKIPKTVSISKESNKGIFYYSHTKKCQFPPYLFIYLLVVIS